MNNKSARTPTWSVWLNVPEVAIWEAVALSLNIDPDRVKHNAHSFMAEEHLFDESKEFDDRITVATRNAGQALRLSTNSLVDTTENKVSLPGFSQWASTIGWHMPDEMLTLENVIPPNARDAANPDKTLGNRERTNLLRIIRALAEMQNLPAKGYAESMRTQLDKLGIAAPSDDTIRKAISAARDLDS